ncbi:MAG TPA: exodeoxyribonuclease VII large subunit [Acidimicrobiia bacterium]|nr:exodeoxyribonuclease VII large subunit [Acidimicrobiia bacterium]
MSAVPAATADASGTLTVSELHSRVERAVVTTLPGPIWVRGEVSGLRRTSRAAVFFRLVDPDSAGHVVEVAARGRVMIEIDRALDSAGVGRLRDGFEIRVRAVAGLEPARSQIRLTLLEVDPAFIAGRLAVDRQQVLERMRADGALAANSRLARPLVPLRIGLVTSRGSAAHADFIDQLQRSGYRFVVRTVHASMQGETAVPGLVRALRHLARQAIDVAVIVRGGGARLDLAAFDAEEVGRAVAAMPVPVVSGIGHETDRSVVDEAASVPVKTPTAAAEWLISAVADYAGRIDTARRMIRDEAREVCRRAGGRLENLAALLVGAETTLARQRDALRHIESGVADGARRALSNEARLLDRWAETLDTLGTDSTLARGFALVTDQDGAVVRTVELVSPGDRLFIRLADGELRVVVEDPYG